MTRFLAATRVNSSSVLRCLVGHFHESNYSAILWGYSDRLEVYHEEPHGGLSLFHKQHTHDKILELGCLHGQRNGLENEPQVSEVHSDVFSQLSSRPYHLARRSGYQINI